MKQWLERRWYSTAPAPALLKPLAALYGAIAARRRVRLATEASALPVPVIVVGNITVGGSGKTPFVIWLVERLREWGYRPGIISRGYGGQAAHYPLRLDAQTTAEVAGDEPALMCRRLGCPIAVAPDRVAAARLLIDSGEVDILVSDDGLQHYRLPRDLEICLVDGRRGFGNGSLLPAGPLREPLARLREVDFVVVNGHGEMLIDEARVRTLQMRLEPESVLRLVDGVAKALADFRDGPVHAVAGIGDPQRFFLQLERAGLQLIRHPFADHHAYRAADLAFGDERPVLMTEKDAIKCRAFDDQRLWSVPVQAQLSPEHGALVRKSIAHLVK